MCHLLEYAQLGVNEYIDLKPEERNSMNGVRKLYDGEQCPPGASASSSQKVSAMALEADVSAPGHPRSFVSQQPKLMLPLPLSPFAVPYGLQASTPCGL